MVKSRVAIISLQEVRSCEDLFDLFQFLSYEPDGKADLAIHRVFEALSAGAAGNRPLVVPDISMAPLLLLDLWPHLWPAMRESFSLRTLFASESLEADHPPHIIVTPKELRDRWRSCFVLDLKREQGPLIDAFEPEVKQLLQVNWELLPSDFAIITKMARIADCLRKLRKGLGSFADVLLIVRTVEAFGRDFKLPEQERRFLLTLVTDVRNAKAVDIRTASLVKFTIVPSGTLREVEEGVSQWIQDNLHTALSEHALWILEHQSGSDHADWWIRAVRKGLGQAFNTMTPEWSEAIWRWWSRNPKAIDWTRNLLSGNPKSEGSLLLKIPNRVSLKLQESLRGVCAHLQWARLLAGVLRISAPLDEAVEILRGSVSDPESALGFLLEKSPPEKIVEVAAKYDWQPLIDRAIQSTKQDPGLLERVDLDAPSLLPMLAAHLKAGGSHPPRLSDTDFVVRLFDGCINSDKLCLDIVQRLGSRAAPIALGYSRRDELWSTLGAERSDSLRSATATAWLNAFGAGEDLERPESVLAEAVRQRARDALQGGAVARVLDYLMMFPEVSEHEVVDWFTEERLLWRDGDEMRLGDLLLKRRWRTAANRFNWSGRQELKDVARHARGLLSLWERIWLSPPSFASVQSPYERPNGQKVKILFLAANPMPSGRLAIDEEARSIEEKVRAASFRDSIEFKTRWAVRPDDLQQTLLEEEPTVVHFSGHGTGPKGLVLHSASLGEEKLVEARALADLFGEFKRQVRIVVLNACYSTKQAEAIVEEIDFVVGMADTIGDDAARAFAGAFYRGLAFGKSVQDAFKLGLNELELLGFKNDENVPVLLFRDGIDASSVRLVGS